MIDVLSKLKISEITQIQADFPAFSFFYNSENLRVKGYVLFPKEIKASNPMVMVNHGGTGEFGKITDEHMNHFSFLPENGYIGLFSQYRGIDGGEGRDRMGGDDVFDIINLYKIFSTLSFVDVNRVGMWGVSRGGMMTFQVLARTAWIKAAVVVAPIVNEVNMASWRPGWHDHQLETYGGSYPEQIKRSVIFWPEQIPKIPILIIHGDKDDKTNHLDSIEVHVKFEKLGIPSELVILQDQDHFISKKSVAKTLEWFKKYL